jgi:hypothetical protein
MLTVTGPAVGLRLDDDSALLGWVRHSAGGVLRVEGEPGPAHPAGRGGRHLLIVA